MTYSTALAAGGAALEYVLRIDGYPYAFATRAGFSTTIGGAVFSAVKVGLDRMGIAFAARARPIDVLPETTDWTATIRTMDAAVLSSLRAVDAGARTVLTTTATSTATTLVVTSTTGFTSPIYVGGEPVSYTNTTPTTFTGCTRGLYGSRGYEHLVDTSIYPPCEPEVTTLPGPMDMRRASLYVAEYAGGALGTPRRIWTGYVSGPVRVRAGEISIPLASTARGLADGLVMGWVTSGRLRGVYIPDRSGEVVADYRTIVLGDFPTGAGSTGTRETVTITAGLYADAAALVDAAITAVAGAASGDWRLEYAASGRLRLSYDGTEAPYCSGRLLWLLGFTDRDGGGSGLPYGTTALEAADAPVDVFALIGEAAGAAAYERRLYLHAGEAAQFLASSCSLYVPQDPETDYRPRRISSVNATDDYLVLAPGSIEGEGDAWPDVVVVRGGGSPPRVTQSWHLSSRVDTIVKAIVGATVSLDYTVPRAWRPLPYLDPTDSSDAEVGDIDFTELAQVVLSAPAELQRATLTITEPMEAREVLRDLLLPLGVYAYVQRAGKIGFKRLRVPSQGEASTTITTAMLDADALPDIEAELSSEAPVTVLRFEIPDGRGALESVSGSGLLCIDLRALQRYGARMPRDTADALGYLQSVATSVRCYSLIGSDVSAWLRVAGQHLSGTLFAWSRAGRAVVRLPVTPAARAVEIGEVVSITAWPLFDPYAGTFGAASKLGLVVGWDESHEAGEGIVDYLDVALVDELYGVIAPSALVTSWSAVNTLGTCADATLYKQTGHVSDLDFFDVGDEVRFVEYDAEAPSTFGPVGITSVSRLAVNGTVGLDADPFGGAFPAGGAVMIFADWTEAVASQQGEGWVWVSDDTTGLVVAAGRAGWQWSP